MPPAIWLEAWATAQQVADLDIPHDGADAAVLGHRHHLAQWHALAASFGDEA